MRAEVNAGVNPGLRLADLPGAAGGEWGSAGVNPGLRAGGSGWDLPV